MRQRQQKIVEFVRNVGIVSVSELAEMFGVSPFTIRRDIDYLSQVRLVAKVKGGAQRIETPSQFNEARLLNRMQINLAQKEKIARKAVEFIHAGDTIFLDGSSTIACLARTIAQVCRNITVVTNSVLISLELSEASDIRLIGLGGIFDRDTFSFVGFDADLPAESFYVDKAFFSCAGFVPDQGTFENAAFNRNIKLLVAQRAAKVFLLIGSEKFGKRALTRVLDGSMIHTIITEKVDDEKIMQQIKESQINLVLADRADNNQTK
jgi:DeoR/GlpR family transcriptional regulator of sugar metabolism